MMISNLLVNLRVEVHVVQDDGIRSSQVEPLPAGTC